ncbi:MAG TPA: glycosyltransferase [Candidatus Baltobacteraceae bacterium]|nr:glycosyltransferase [Candidatus Baltobacteraceae bacterium]
MSAQPKISVIIPLKRINAYLRESLQHLTLQTYRNFDVFVITDEPETLEVRDLDVKWLSSGPVPPNIKRMMAAKQSDAEIVALLDDDAYPAPVWLAAAAAHFEDERVVGVGGPGVTPPHDPPLQQASGAVYVSPLVSARYTYRYLPDRPRDVDDYPSCNLIVRRKPFLEHVPQCLKYWPGEDTKLCLLLTKSGDRIIYDPSAAVYHHRRSLFWGHFRQVWNYAVHRGFFAKRYPETSLRPAYFVPSAFLVANAALLLALASPQARGIAALAAAAYCVVVLWSALRSRRSHAANVLVVSIGIYLTHLTYGLGFMLGLLRPELDH